MRRILNAGAGGHSSRGIAPIFASSEWEEVRLDVDPSVDPTAVGSITDMKDLFEPAFFDAIQGTTRLLSGRGGANRGALLFALLDSWSLLFGGSNKFRRYICTKSLCARPARSGTSR